jgi:hypothetical protein
MPVPAPITRVADDGHSVDPMSVVVVVPPIVVVVPPIVVVVPPIVVVVPPIVVVVPPSVVVVPPIVVVVPPPIVVVVVPGTVVDVVVDEVVEVVNVVEVVVVTGQGQFSVTLWPTAFFKQMSASLAVVPPAPLVSHTHAGVHVDDPTAVRRMKRQSDAVGPAPFVTGWPLSPWAARAAGGATRVMVASRAAPKEINRPRMRIGR